MMRGSNLRMRYSWESRGWARRIEVRAGDLVRVREEKATVEGRCDRSEDELEEGAIRWVGRVLLTIGRIPRAVKPTRTIADWVKGNRWHVRRQVVVSDRAMYAYEVKD